MAHRPADTVTTASPNQTSRPQTVTAAAPTATATVSAPAPPPPPFINCNFSPNADGSAFAQVYIEPDVVRRLRSRAGSQDMAKYLWENIFYKALIGHVY